MADRFRRSFKITFQGVFTMQIHETELWKRAKASAEVLGITVGDAYRKLKAHERGGDVRQSDGDHTLEPVSYRSTNFWQLVDDYQQKTGCSGADARKYVRTRYPDVFENMINSVNGRKVV